MRGALPLLGFAENVIPFKVVAAIGAGATGATGVVGVVGVLGVVGVVGVVTGVVGVVTVEAVNPSFKKTAVSEFMRPLF